MDDAVELARFVRQAFDEHERRLSKVESQRAELRGVRAELARMRRRVQLLEQMLDVRVHRSGIAGRQAAVVALREQGASLSVISLRLGIGIRAVRRHLAEAGVEPPDVVQTVDGRRLPTRPRNGNGTYSPAAS